MNAIESQHLDSPLGTMIVAATTQGLCGVWFEGQRHFPSKENMKNWKHQSSHGLLKVASQQLQAYFAGELERFDLPIDLSSGTVFQQAVWRALLKIPAGQSQTYGELAKLLDKPLAVRAVGAAVGRNPVSILVPCHRVLGAGGQLTGYAGGLWRKQALLKREGHPMGQLSPDMLSE